MLQKVSMHTSTCDRNFNHNFRQGNVEKTTNNEGSPSYQLICYSLKTWKTLCYRKLQNGQNDVNEIHYKDTVKFTVPLLGQEKVLLDDIKICLLGDVVGIDSYQVTERESQLGKVDKDTFSRAASSANTGKKTKKTKQTTAAVNGRNRKDNSTLVDSNSARSEIFKLTADSAKENICKEGFYSSEFLARDEEPSLSQCNFSKYELRMDDNEIASSQINTANHSSQLSQSMPIEGKKPLSLRNTCASIESTGKGSHEQGMNELALIRTKANELQLGSIPVKRLRLNYGPSRLNSVFPSELITPVRNAPPVAINNDGIRSTPPSLSQTLNIFSSTTRIEEASEAHPTYSLKPEVEAADRQHRKEKNRPLRSFFSDAFQENSNLNSRCVPSLISGETDIAAILEPTQLTSLPRNEWSTTNPSVRSNVTTNSYCASQGATNELLLTSAPSAMSTHDRISTGATITTPIAPKLPPPYPTSSKDQCASKKYPIAKSTSELPVISNEMYEENFDSIFF